MQSSSPLFLFGILFGIMATFAVYASILEFFKYNQYHLGPQLPYFYSSARLKRRVMGYVIALAVLFLFVLGLYFLPWPKQPVLFVLYWWSTFTLALLLFLIPALDLRETFHQVHEHQQKNGKAEKDLVVRMIFSGEDTTQTSQEDPLMETSGSEDDDLTDPPTMH